MDSLEPSLSTPAVRLQRLTLQDASSYFDLFDANRSHIAEHDGRLAASFTTISAVAEHLSSYNANYRQHFAVIKEGEFVGSTALFTRPGDQTTEIAYWIDRKRTGQRLATHACQLLINHAHTDLGKTHFEARIAPSNIPSIKTIQSLGFNHTATLEEDDVYSLSI